MRIALDLDGVVAEWDHAFAALLSSLTGRTPVRPSVWPTEWHWPEADGYTNKEISAAWEFIDANPEWWFYLQPTPEAARNAHRIAQLSDQEELFIVTNRRKALNPSMAWVLREFGVAIPVIPFVGHKGPLFDLMGFDIAIDDRPENLTTAQTVERLILIDRPSNQLADDPRLERKTLTEFLDELLPAPANHHAIALEPIE